MQSMYGTMDKVVVESFTIHGMFLEAYHRSNGRYPISDVVGKGWFRCKYVQLFPCTKFCL